MADAKIMKIFADSGKFCVSRQQRVALVKNFRPNMSDGNRINNPESGTALVRWNSTSPRPHELPPVSTLISPSFFSFLRHLHTSGEREKRVTRRPPAILLSRFSFAIYFSTINSFRDASCEWQPSSCRLHTIFLIYKCKSPATVSVKRLRITVVWKDCTVIFKIKKNIWECKNYHNCKINN